MSALLARPPVSSIANAELLLQDSSDCSEDYGHENVENVGIVVSDVAVRAVMPCDCKKILVK